MAKFFKVPVYYQVCEYVSVKADSAEQARQWVDDNQDRIPTHLDNPKTSYVDESFEVEQKSSCVFEVKHTDVGSLYYTACDQDTETREDNE